MDQESVRTLTGQASFQLFAVEIGARALASREKARLARR